jgi:uncharacterized lipoprotein YddW (UPF0748 family)
MKKCLLSLLSFACFCIFAHAQQAPKREVRGAWIATYANIDWPKIRTEPVALQRAALISILDHHQATGINTIYFQIRSQCDAMYPSEIEPWSADLTGTQGKAPVELSLTDPSSTKVWDPLKFIIDACHERGMELHAWINPYRAINNYNVIHTFAPNHVARQHPEWLLSQGTLRILNPGIPAAQAYVRRVIGDVVSRYDLDGIHFDDYFYPSPPPAGTPPYNDDATFNADPRGFTDRGDWRRDNVNRFIHSVSDTIQALKPWVKFGVSPSGIYRNSTNPDIGSATSGLQHYVTLFADSRKWLQEGWIDYLAPQVYWYIGQPAANYAVVVPWWNNNAYGRHIYIGMAGYKVNDPLQGVNWANPSMIPNEVRLNRSPAYPNIFGQAIYNTSSLLSTSRLGFRDSLRTNFYKYPALLPRMPWRDDMAPEPATALTGTRHGADSVVLNWTAPADVANEFDRVKRFVLYRSENPVIDFSNPANIVAITPTPVTHYIDKQLPKDTTYYYTVTSLDRFHNESLPSNVTDYSPPVIVCVPDQQLDMDVSCKLTLPDYTALATVSDDVSIPTDISVVQLPAAGTGISGPAITVVTLTATDASGKSSSCSFMVIGTDRLAPVITGTPENIVASTGEESADCSAVVSWTEPIATDNCTTPLTYFTRTYIPGTAFPVGTTKVTYTFRDEAGNEDSTSFDIVVMDDTKPVVITRNITRSLADGAVTITAEDVNNGSWDNCGISSLAVSPANFTCADIGENTVTLTAVDVHGNENTVTAIVTVTGSIPQPFIDISREDNVFTGLPENTIALGYGAQALKLSVINTEDVSSEIYYEWSPAMGLSNTNGASTVFTPSTEGSYTFMVEVINEYGCSATADVTVHVIDVRCGNKDNKVQLCRTAGEHSVELCVAPQAVGVLLRTGAKLGSCQWSEIPEETPQASVLTAFPNPFEQHINLQFELPVSDTHVRLDIYDVFGGRGIRVFDGPTEAGQVQDFSLSVNELRGKVFLVRLLTSTGKSYYIKVIRQE